jgi:predicted nucleotidyltransferase
LPKTPDSMKFGLSEKSWQILDQVLIQPLKKLDVQLWIFGSRARGDHQPFSDIDILFVATQPIPNATLFLIKSNIEESRLPIKVDLVNASDLAESYRTTVETEKIQI